MVIGSGCNFSVAAITNALRTVDVSSVRSAARMVAPSPARVNVDVTFARPHQRGERTLTQRVRSAVTTFSTASRASPNSIRVTGL